MPPFLKLFHIFLRVVQFVFVVLVLALSGALIQQQDRGGSPTRINYSIFVAAFAAVTHLYLFPATLVDSIASPLVMAVLDFLNAVFFLCGGIAMAAQLHGRQCIDYRFVHTNGITDGGGYLSPVRRCREANAMTAFEWFAFAAFAASWAVDLWNWKQKREGERGGGGGGGGGGSSSSRNGRGGMGQV